MTRNRISIKDQEPGTGPSNIAIDSDRISLDFNGVHLVGHIVKFSWHLVLVRLVAPVDLPVMTSREIKFYCPPREERFLLYDENGHELPELSPLGIQSTANLVVEIWLAYQAAIEHTELLRKFHELPSVLPPGVHPSLVMKCWEAREQTQMPVLED